MPERDRRKETLRAGAPLVVGGMTLVPVERTVTHCLSGTSHAWLSIEKAPHAVVVCDRSGVRAFDAAAAEVPVDRLRDEVAGLGAILASLAAGPRAG